MSASGYTMIEVVVSVTAVIIVMGVLLTGLPATRANQELRLAQQQVQSLVHEALTRSLNETREPGCLPNQPGSVRKICSDAGVAFRGGNLILFADLNNNGQYDSETVDSRIRQETLPGSVTAVESNNYIYKAVPPTISMVGVGSTAKVTLQRGTQQIQLRIQRYGQVERES